MYKVLNARRGIVWEEEKECFGRSGCDLFESLEVKEDESSGRGLACLTGQNALYLKEGAASFSKVL